MPGQKRFTRASGFFCLCATLLLVGLSACGTGGVASSTASSESGNISTPTPMSASTVTPTPTFPPVSTVTPTPTVTPTLTPETTPTATPTTASTPLSVTSVDITVSPASISTLPCGTPTVIVYKATFSFAANSAGGQVNFEYTVNNGRSSTAGSLTVAPGGTTAVYKFTWSGPLPADHTMPEPGGVIVTSPNAVNSPLVGPTGKCIGGA